MVEEILDLDTAVAYITTNEDDDKRTALHIAASRGHVDVMKILLSCCPDCWEIDNIKGQNILQIAVKSNKGNVVSFIQTSDILFSLRNQKYDDNNTTLEPDGPDFMWRRRSEPSETIAHIGLRNLFMLKRRHLSRFKSLISKNREVRSARHSYGGKSIEEVRKMADTHMIVAALVATVSFTAGLTMPGGYDGNAGPNSGMAMLSRRAAFKGFIVSDTIAMMLSVGAIVLYFDAARSYDEDEFQELCNIAGAVVMNALTAMMIAFVTGTYAVLTHSLALAIATCVLGSTMAMLTFIYAMTYNIREYVAN